MAPSIFHDHTKAQPQALRGHVRVTPKEDFDAYINGTERVKFVKGQRHPRAFLPSEVAPWVKLGRFSQVLSAEQLLKVEAQEREDKAEADKKAANEAAKKKASADAKAEQERLEAEKKAAEDALEADKKAADEAANSSKLPTESQLESMNKDTLIAQGHKEKAAFEESQSKAQIVKAILAARAA